MSRAEKLLATLLTVSRTGPVAFALNSARQETLINFDAPTSARVGLRSNDGHGSCDVFSLSASNGERVGVRCRIQPRMNTDNPDSEG